MWDDLDSRNNFHYDRSKKDKKFDWKWRNYLFNIIFDLWLWSRSNYIGMELDFYIRKLYFKNIFINNKSKKNYLRQKIGENNKCLVINTFFSILYSWVEFRKKKKKKHEPWFSSGYVSHATMSHNHFISFEASVCGYVGSTYDNELL